MSPRAKASRAPARRNPARADEAKRRARNAVRRLARWYGEGHPDRPAPERREPLDELILTVLSQNTSDTNRDRAWAALREAFPTWEAVADARVDAIERAIRPGGLSRQKAPRIQGIVRQIRGRHGRITLDHLAAMSNDEVVEELTSYKGVGAKTAACVLAFSLGRGVLPVDTHVGRIGERLGFVRPGSDPAVAQQAWESLIPPAARVDGHLDLIAHGRAVCSAQRPKCDICPIADLCPSAGTFDAARPSNRRR